jgi:hypothetical protein
MNLYAEFLALLPDDPVQYVKILTHNGDGTSTVELPSGEQFRVRGTSVAPDDYAYVQAGRIIEEAPALPVHYENV